MANREKILIVTDAWRPQKNGVVIAVEKMKELLEKKGYGVAIAHPYLSSFRLPLFFYPEIEFSIFPSRIIRTMVAKEMPDYIHIATEGPLGLAARNYCVRNKIRFTTSYHTHYPIYLKLRLGFLFDAAYRYIRWLHRDAVRTMVATETMKEELLTRKFEHLVIWPLGVDVDFFKKNEHATLPDYLKDTKKPLFIYFGRVAIEKNVEAFLKCDLPGTRLVVGGGPQCAELKRNYGNTAIFAHTEGYKKDKELVDLLSLADVFVFPSKTETFGLVALEALACELPVAAYNVMGPKDIIRNNVDGVLDDDLENAALRCLTLSRKKLRERALAFSWDNSAEAFIKNLAKN